MDLQVRMAEWSAQRGGLPDYQDGTLSARFTQSHPHIADRKDPGCCLSQGCDGTVTVEPSPGSSSAMTTRELQQHWRALKSGRKPVKLLFDVPSSRTVEQSLSKYVVYQIVLIKSGSYDSKQVFIERRYSDFERLHQRLLQDFSEELEDVGLPRKRLTGNFAEESITERRVAFRDYLAQLYAIRCIRKSPVFLDFFTRPELRLAHSCLRGGQYSQALEKLLHVLDLQEKLTQHSPCLLVPTLCAIMVCQRDLDEPARAFETGQQVMPLVRRYGLDRYRCPLLATLVDLGYQLGQPIAHLQEELSQVRDAERGLVSTLSLKELAVQEFTE
ncbi:sorting nexin-20 isoform X2 [Brienomyrus brachyistius]|uniref:sorting nexin-20 isoform X2 n=1 Tax=Brienomyrus brachyistius TaxID=42636 RepID=UPI0020B332E4|nr:sorting nexin-20 isoform X2 [Brienomyrus brachyistius]